jgi:hypothetical protein
MMGSATTNHLPEKLNEKKKKKKNTVTKENQIQFATQQQQSQLFNSAEETFYSIVFLPQLI